VQRLVRTSVMMVSKWGWERLCDVQGASWGVEVGGAGHWPMLLGSAENEMGGNLAVDVSG
jgi:hypothetical protein